jgi:hypothetical protein
MTLGSYTTASHQPMMLQVFSIHLEPLHPLSTSATHYIMKFEQFTDRMPDRCSAMSLTIRTSAQRISSY